MIIASYWNSDDSHGPQSADTMTVSSDEESSQRLDKDRRKRKVDTVNREEINQSNVHITTEAFDEANEAASKSKRTKFGLQESQHHNDDDGSCQGSDVELPQRIVSSIESIMENEAKKKIETESDTERDIDGNIKSLIGRPIIDEFENTVIMTNDVPSRNDHVHVQDNSFFMNCKPQACDLGNASQTEYISDLIKILRQQKALRLSDKLSQTVTEFGKVIAFEGLSLPQYVLAKNARCKQIHNYCETCLKCSGLINAAKLIIEKNIVSLPYLWHKCYPNISYDSGKAQRKFLQMLIGVLNVNKVIYRVYKKR